MYINKQQQNIGQYWNSSQHQSSKKKLRSQASMFFSQCDIQLSSIIPVQDQSNQSDIFWDSFIISNQSTTSSESSLSEQLPQRRSIEYIQRFLFNYKDTRPNVKSRLKYYRLPLKPPQVIKIPVRVQEIKPKPTYQYQYRRPLKISSTWNRGTKIVHNQTTELNLKLNEIDESNKTQLIPEIVRLILSVQFRHENSEENIDDAVRILVEKIWSSSNKHKIYAQIFHKAIYSYEYGQATVSFQNGMTRELKYAFQSLQFDVSYWQQPEQWRGRVIRTCQFIGLMYINATYPKYFIDECYAHCMERILLSQNIPIKQKRDAWTESWFLAIWALTETVGYKLELSQVKDEMVTQGLTAFIESVKDGIVAQIRVSTSLIFQFFEFLQENFNLTQVVLGQIFKLKILKENKWMNPQFSTPSE